MTFIVSCRYKGAYRCFLEWEGNRTMEEGTPLEFEAEHPTADGLIFKLLDVILDDNFHAIDFGAKAYRCKKTP